MLKVMMATAMALGVVGAANAQAPRLVSEDLMVNAEGGVQIFVRNKRPEGVTTFASDRIALFVHGATYPGTAFDLALHGKSWMDYLAERGFDTYAFDLPSYGRSTRAPAMEVAAEENPPLTRGSEAVKALGSVVDHILKRRGAPRVSLIGWSWGTTIVATYATERANTVERVVLYAPIWLRTTPSLVRVEGKLGAYRTVSRDQALARWLTGVPEDKKAGLIPAGWFEAWAEATFATDPKGGGKTLRAPNGVIQDAQEFWAATPPKPYWDPEKITAPVLLVVGEWDRDTPPYMAQTLFPLLTQAPWKRLAMLSEATHTILMEKNRVLLFRSVQQFLEEAPPTVAASQ
jgi:pimeloyl-ACP methyl ester carboxylesterase